MICPTGINDFSDVLKSSMAIFRLPETVQTWIRRHQTLVKYCSCPTLCLIQWWHWFYCECHVRPRCCSTRSLADSRAVCGLAKSHRLPVGADWRNHVAQCCTCPNRRQRLNRVAQAVQKWCSCANCKPFALPLVVRPVCLSHTKPSKFRLPLSADQRAALMLTRSAPASSFIAFCRRSCNAPETSSVLTVPFHCCLSLSHRLPPNWATRVYRLFSGCCVLLKHVGVVNLATLRPPYQSPYRPQHAITLSVMSKVRVGSGEPCSLKVASCTFSAHCPPKNHALVRPISHQSQ